MRQPTLPRKHQEIVDSLPPEILEQHGQPRATRVNLNGHGRPALKFPDGLTLVAADPTDKIVITQTDERCFAQVNNGPIMLLRKTETGFEVDHEAIKAQREADDQHMREVGERTIRESHAEYTVEDSAKGERPYVLVRECDGRETRVDIVERVANGDFFSAPVRVAITRWIHFVMYAVFFEQPQQHQKTDTHADWPARAREHLARLGPVGVGYLEHAKSRAFTVTDRPVFDRALQTDNDTAALTVVFDIVREGRETVAGCRRAEERVRRIISAVEKWAERGCALFPPRERLRLNVAERHLYKTVLSCHLTLHEAAEHLPARQRQRLLLAGIAFPLRSEHQVTSAELVIRFLKSNEGKSLITARRLTMESLRAAFENWRDGTGPDNAARRKRRERLRRNQARHRTIHTLYLFPQMKTYRLHDLPADL